MIWYSVASYLIFIFGIYIALQSQKSGLLLNKAFYQTWLFMPLGFDIALYIFFRVIGSFLFWMPLFGLLLFYAELMNRKESGPKKSKNSQPLFPKRPQISSSLIFWILWSFLGISSYYNIFIQFPTQYNIQNTPNTYLYLYLLLVGASFIRSLFYTPKISTGSKINPEARTKSPIGILNLLIFFIFLLGLIPFFLQYFINGFIVVKFLDNLSKWSLIYTGLFGFLSFLLLIQSNIQKRLETKRAYHSTPTERQKNPIKRTKIRHFQNVPILDTNKKSSTQKSSAWNSGDTVIKPQTCPKCHSDLDNLYCTLCKQKICPICMTMQASHIRLCTCGYSFTEREIMSNQTKNADNKVVENHNQAISTESKLIEDLTPGQISNNIDIPLDKPPRICPYCHAVGWKEDICRCGYNYLTKEYEPKKKSLHPENGS